MLTDEMRADGWIEHDGGPCPVDTWQPISIMRRDGITARHPDCRWLDWQASDPEALEYPSDIIAYKPESHHG